MKAENIIVGTERTVYLDCTDVNHVIGYQAITNFNSYFRHRTGSRLNLLLDKISESDVQILYDEAFQLAKVAKAIDFLTCLKVTFGVDSQTNQVKAIYSGVFLTYDESYYDASANEIARFIYGGEGAKHIIFNGGLIGYVGNDPTDGYHNDIYVSDLGDGKFRPTKHGITIDDDVESHIFSFQEVFAFFKINKLSEIYLYNATRSVNKRIKHGLLFTPVDLLLDPEITLSLPFFGINALTPQIAEGFIVGDYANLSHLCPPSCDKAFIFLMG
ncbi:MAG: hypothetical protein JWP12_3793 [Bacteroidetes bacterium]|nr:hypothetical protein [Bacteroidota bacterium]